MQDGVFLRGLSREGFSKPLLKSFCNDVGDALRDSAHIVKTLASCPHLRAIFSASLTKSAQQLTLQKLVSSIATPPACYCSKCNPLKLQTWPGTWHSPQPSKHSPQPSMPAHIPAPSSPPSPTDDPELAELEACTATLKKSMSSLEAQVVKVFNFISVFVFSSLYICPFNSV